MRRQRTHGRGGGSREERSMLYVGLAGGAEAGGDGVGRWVGSSGDGERSSGGDCAHGWLGGAACHKDVQKLKAHSTSFERVSKSFLMWNMYK